MSHVDKTAIYCRLSKEDGDKEESESIQNQKDLLTQYAKEQGWSIYQVYSDDDYRGCDRERPAFRRLIADAQSGKFQIVLCKSQSRFTRDMEIVEKYIHGAFLLWGIRFVTVADHADTAIKGNKKARQINGLVNEWYLEDLSDNIRAVLDNKRKQGKYIGSFPLYGYLKNPEDKNALVIDEEAAAVVKKIYQLYLHGNGIYQITRILNEDGIQNPLAHKMSLGMRCQRVGKRSAMWNDFTIRSILSNRMYTGDMVQGIHKTVSYKSKKQIRQPENQWFIVKDTHEAIIDRETFSKTQERLRQHTRPMKENGTVNPLAGKIRCIYCGGTMRRNYSKGASPYFYCRSRETAKFRCGHGVRYTILVDTVLEKINEKIHLWNDDTFLQKHLIEFNATIKAKERWRSRLEKLRAEMTANKTMALNLYADKVKGMISESTFLEWSELLEEQKEKLCKESTVLEQRISANLGEEKGSLKEHILKKYSSLQELTLPLVTTMIDFLEVGKDDNHIITLRIHWSF